MNHFQKQRQAFIEKRLRKYGKIARHDIMSRFDVSTVTAANDIRRWAQENPGIIMYVPRQKAWLTI